MCCTPAHIATSLLSHLQQRTKESTVKSNEVNEIKHQPTCVRSQHIDCVQRYIYIRYLSISIVSVVQLSFSCFHRTKAKQNVSQCYFQFNIYYVGCARRLTFIDLMCQYNLYYDCNKSTQLHSTWILHRFSSYPSYSLAIQYCFLDNGNCYFQS